MKNKLNSQKRSVVAFLFGLCALALVGGGCTNAAQKFRQFEKLGVTHAEIQGKFSSTEYNVEEKDGKRIATLEHNNGWFPKVEIVRERPLEN